MTTQASRPEGAPTGRVENIEIDLPFGWENIKEWLGCSGLIVGLLLLILCGGIGPFVYFDGRDGLSEEATLIFFICAAICCLIGALVFVYFSRDVYVNHPRKIVIDERGVELQKHRREEYISWGLVKGALHEEEWSWTLKTEQEDLVIEEVWVSDEQWEQIVTTLNSRLKARYIPIEFDPLDDEDDDDDIATSRMAAHYEERIASLEAKIDELEEREQ